MIYIKKPGIYFAVFVLAMGVTVISCQTLQEGASQERRQSMENPGSTMSMGEMVQRADQIENETSQMMNSMRGGMMMGGNNMMDMSQNMNHLANGMRQMMSNLDVMMSNEKLMRNESFKEHAESMRQHIASMVSSCEEIVGSMKKFNQTEEK